MNTYDRKPDSLASKTSGGTPDHDFDAEHDPDRSRRVSDMLMRRYIQKRAVSGASTEATHAAAEQGVASATTSLPFADKIQASFGGAHDVSQIQAHVGGDSAGAMGASAYATGNHVVFDKSPDLHTAAHEAAHVVQQARGVNLYGGVGEAGDSYEQHADAVADRVVAGQSAADLLSGMSGGSSSRAIQKDEIGDTSTATGKAWWHSRATSESAVLQSLELATAEMTQAYDAITGGKLSHAEASKLIGPVTQVCSRVFDQVREDTIDAASPRLQTDFHTFVRAYAHYEKACADKKFEIAAVAHAKVEQTAMRFKGDSYAKIIETMGGMVETGKDPSTLLGPTITKSADALIELGSVVTHVEDQKGVTAGVVHRAESHLATIRSVLDKHPELKQKNKDLLNRAYIAVLQIRTSTTGIPALREEGDRLLSHGGDLQSK